MQVCPCHFKTQSISFLYTVICLHKHTLRVLFAYLVFPQPNNYVSRTLHQNTAAVFLEQRLEHQNQETTICTLILYHIQLFYSQSLK